MSTEEIQSGAVFRADRPSSQTWGLWVSFLSARSFQCYELASFVISFLWYELVLWIIVENKTIITDFSSPLNSSIHFLGFSYTDGMFSFRLMFIWSWQTLPVYCFREIKISVLSQFKIYFFFPVPTLNWKMSYQHRPKIITSKFQWIWRIQSQFSKFTVPHQEDTKLHHLMMPSHVLLLVNVLPFSPFLTPGRNGK